MVFVCDHCHFELEAVAKPCQCPDCGKLDHIRTATAEEGRVFPSMHSAMILTPNCDHSIDESL